MEMQIDILTLFPESVDAMLNVSILGRAQERGYIAIRTHQIRAHMKHIGHPLPGDFLYHPDYSRIARQALHSYKLSFLHPITKQPMVFTAPIPEDMQALLSDDAHTG